MGRKFRILFCVPAYSGHLNPSLTIAKRLIENGHTVGYCTGSTMKGFLLKNSVHAFYARDTYQALMDTGVVESVYKFWRTLSRSFTPQNLQACLQELLSGFDDFKPDVVYFDSFDLMVYSVAEKYQIPFVQGSPLPLYFFEKDIPPIGTGWNVNRIWINRVRLLGYLCAVIPFITRIYFSFNKAIKTIDPTWKTNIISGVSPYLFIHFSTDKFEYRRNTFIPQLFFIGPSVLIPEETELPDFPWERINPQRPLVYIATGTLFPERYKLLYRYAMEALSEKTFPLPIQVVMAIGKNQSILELGEIPANFIVVNYAPQLKLLEKASVVINHGGNTVHETFLYGKPMLVVSLGGDRLELAQRVAHYGAGIRLDLKDITVRGIRRSVFQLLREPRYARAAEGIMCSYRRCDAAKTGASLIELLAATRSPMHRKEGAPLTLEGIGDLRGYLDETTLRKIADIPT